MWSLVTGLARSETVLHFWENAANIIPESLQTQVAEATANVQAAADRVVSSLTAIPDNIRFVANQVSTEVSVELTEIQRSLPEGPTQAFVPEEVDTMQMYNNLPRFGRDVALTMRSATGCGRGASRRTWRPC